MGRNGNINKNTQDIQSSLKRATILFKRGDFKGCVEECDTAIKQGYKNGKIYNLEAIALAQLQCYDEAMDAIIEAIKLDPTNKKYSMNRDLIIRKISTISQMSTYEWVFNL